MAYEVFQFPPLFLPQSSFWKNLYFYRISLNILIICLRVRKSPCGPDFIKWFNKIHVLYVIISLSLNTNCLLFLTHIGSNLTVSISGQHWIYLSLFDIIYSFLIVYTYTWELIPFYHGKFLFLHFWNYFQGCFHV